MRGMGTQVAIGFLRINNVTTHREAIGDCFSCGDPDGIIWIRHDIKKSWDTLYKSIPDDINIVKMFILGTKQ